MNSKDFLKLIGAPWAAFHDHPNPKTRPSLAEIRPAGSDNNTIDIAASINGCNWPGDFYPNGEVQSARRDLIVQAPRMYQYIASMAAVGDTEAKMILREVHRDE